MKAAITFVLMLVASASAEASDPLGLLIGASDLIVIGEITDSPTGIMLEAGVMHWLCHVRVSKVLKGAAPKQEALYVDVVRYGWEKDRPHYLKKGGHCILFLKRAGIKAKPMWETVDVWFGIQPNNESMARELVLRSKRETVRKGE